MFTGLPKRVLVPMIALAFAGGIVAAVLWVARGWELKLAAIVAIGGCVAARLLVHAHRFFKAAPVSRDERIGEDLAALAMAVMGFWIGLGGVKLVEAWLRAREMNWDSLWG